ncbi:pectate lyase [Colletotrichum camelliae]|nr:pectate lyase [Colletotrichum camelliae]
MASRLVLFTLAALAAANPINPGGRDAERPARRHIGGVGHLARAVMAPQQAKVEVRFAGSGGGGPGNNGSCEDDGSNVSGKATDPAKDKSKDKTKDKSKDKSKDKNKDKGSGSGSGSGSVSGSGSGGSKSGGSTGGGGSSSGGGGSYLGGGGSSANNGTNPGGGGSSGGGSSGGVKKITGAFDGGMKLYDRVPSTCTGGEGNRNDAAFILEDGATLSNAIIGGGAGEGVQCVGSCTLENVWWDKVCEDAATFRQTGGKSTVRGGGARGGSDKVFQHNGGGEVEVIDFYAQNIGQLYRSCGNCKEQTARTSTFTNIYVDGAKTIVHVNGNLGDKATVNGACILGGATVCKNSKGTTSGEPGDAPNDPNVCSETNVKTSGC